MNSVTRWALVLAAVAALACVGFVAYDAGLARGVEQAGRMTVAAAPAAPPAPGAAYPMPYAYPYPYWYRPWGFGHFFGPLFFLFFWFAIARALFWRGRHGACRSAWLDEWHRRAHESGAGAATPR
jgi:hypothetical protein